MNENRFLAPPIPPPSGDVCAICGAEVRSAREFCPHCGARLRQQANTTSCWVALASAVLMLLALAFGGAGACFLLFASAEFGYGQKSQIYGIVAFCFAAMLVCGWAVWALNRRKN